MPSYDYQCNDCENITELMRTISKRNEPVICSKCGGSMQKLIGSGSTFKFVGDGFFCNDYGRDKVLGVDN